MSDTQPTTLSKEDLQRVADQMRAATTGFSRQLDGSVRINVTIPVDIVTVLESQAEGAGEPFDVFLQKQVEEALNAFVMSSAG